MKVDGVAGELGCSIYVSGRVIYFATHRFASFLKVCLGAMAHESGMTLGSRHLVASLCYDKDAVHLSDSRAHTLIAGLDGHHGVILVMHMGLVIIGAAMGAFSWRLECSIVAQCKGMLCCNLYNLGANVGFPVFPRVWQAGTLSGISCIALAQGLASSIKQV